MMHRLDILSMTDQDLEGYSNRGTVKRARKELDKIDDLHSLVSIDDNNTIEIQWPDRITTCLPGNTTFPDGECTCPATVTCRHIIMLALAYQTITENTDVDEIAEWDPGDISDKTLASFFSSAVIAKATRVFQEGTLVELTRSEKPRAILETQSIALRFLVKGDPRYVQSDSEPGSVEVATLIAIWAFRRLPSDVPSGYISTHSRRAIKKDFNPEVAIKHLRTLVLFGLAHAPPHLSDQIKRAAMHYNTAEWLWPAENLQRIIRQMAYYTSRDGLFDPHNLLRNTGEFLCRYQALCADTLPIPEVLVRGSKTRQKAQTGKSRFIGLGCKMSEIPAGVKAEAFFQSTDTGATVVMERFVNSKDKESSELTSFSTLAQSLYINQQTIYQLAKSQVLTATAKRSVDNHIVFGRHNTVNPQSYQWDNLRAPLLIDDFKELSRRLSARPPSPFRSLKSNETFYVLSVDQIKNTFFDNKTQCVRATVFDKKQDSIELTFPYALRGKDGAEALLSLLNSEPMAIQYIAGIIMELTGTLSIEPVSIIYNKEGSLNILQPSIEKNNEAFQLQPLDMATEQSTLLTRSTSEFIIDELEALLSDMITFGLDQMKKEKQWQTVSQNAKVSGFHTLHRLMETAAPIFVDVTNANALTSIMKLITYLRLCKA